jgi:hypothetical protein
VLLPVYAAVAAALLFYLLVPVVGAFMLRQQWRRFRDRVAVLGVSPRLRYRDIAAAQREGRSEVGLFRLSGIIEAIEGNDRVWVRGTGVSALVDLSRAPLYVLAPGAAEAGSVQRMRWSSVSSLVEGTNISVGGILELEGGRPVFVDRPEEALIAVCHDGQEGRLASRLTAAGRAPNEYWNYPTRISLALGLVVISSILLFYRTSVFSTVRAMVFLLGASPVLPFAPPGLALFFLYHRLWRRALAYRTERDLLRLPLRFEALGASGSPRYLRRELGLGEAAPANATRIGKFEGGTSESAGLGAKRTLFDSVGEGGAPDESFLIGGDPEILAREADRMAFLSAIAAGLSFGLAILGNLAIAFLIWRHAL